MSDVKETDAKVIYDWLREPDFAETFTTADLLAWLKRRPTGIAHRLMTSPAPSPAEALPSQTSGAVKPLEWRRHPEDGSLAREGQNEKRDYVQRALHAFGAYFLMVKDGVYSIKSSREPYRDEPGFETADLARAYAETEYTEAILSALAKPASEPAGGVEIKSSKALERLEAIASYQPRPNMKRELREIAGLLRAALSSPGEAEALPAGVEALTLEGER